MQRTSDINVVETRPLPSPAALLAEVPKTEAQAEFVTRSRRDIHRLIFTDDRRLLLIVGPCSIHDVDAGREYARTLAFLAREVADRVMIVMRVYFEKPRTTVGWKGLIMDPHLDGSNDIAAGLRIARSFLRDVLDLGLPTATELLDPITPQYIADLICWSAIGARTAESQTHRQMASGLSMPIGFKNGTDGSVQTAINAIRAASQPQTFLGINLEGAASAVVTAGNPNCHIVLRGGSAGPNYSAEQVAEDGGGPPGRRALQVDPRRLLARQFREEARAPARRHARPPGADRGAATRRSWAPWSKATSTPGASPFPSPGRTCGAASRSPTPCIGWATTEGLVREVHAALAARFS